MVQIGEIITVVTHVSEKIYNAFILWQKKW